jgi:CRP-like cAMP-binding protein
MPAEIRHKIAAAATLKTFGRGELIASELSSPSQLILLLEGGVQICRRTDEGTRVVFRILRAPVALGFMLLSGQPHTADIVAADSVLVALVPVAMLRSVFEANPQLLYRVITRLTELVDALSGELMEQRTLPLADRLRVAILRNADERGELHLSHDELAELVGSTRANVTRALRQLADAGKIKVRRRVIRIEEA